MSTIKINNKLINYLHMKIYKAPKVIAEIGCNHKGEIEIAKELIRVVQMLPNFKNEQIKNC